MNSITSGPKKDDLVLIDCIYYSFYIKKSELKKYKINNNNNINLVIDIECINGLNSNDSSKNLNIFNFSNILDKLKILEILIMSKNKSTQYLYTMCDFLNKYR